MHGQPHWRRLLEQDIASIWPQALETMRANFEPTTGQACWEHVVSGKSARGRSRAGLSEGAVYVAKSRVLRG